MSRFPCLLASFTAVALLLSSPAIYVHRVATADEKKTEVKKTEKNNSGEKKAAKAGLTANEMMVRAHEARATWDGFPGFEAKLVAFSGGERREGRLRVTADQEVDIKLPAADGFEWVDSTIGSLVQHRFSTGENSFNVEFADNEVHHPLGRLIRFKEDRLHSVYRIKNDYITEVHRTMGDTRFTISVLEITRNAEKKYMPRVYSVSFWNAKTGELTSNRTVRDAWQTVGKWDLPKSTLTVMTGSGGERQVRELRFQDVKLLSKN